MNDNISIQNLSDSDSTDKNIILLITKGYTSSYAIWAFMKKEAKEIGHGRRVMTYKNINTRVIKLFNAGFIEEVEQTGRPPHGRIDYKVSMKGLEELIPDVLVHPEELKSVIEYMDKFGLDIVSFGLLLLKKYTRMTELVHEYHKLALYDVSDVTYERGRDVYEGFHRAVSNLVKDIGAVKEKQFQDTMTTVKLFDKRTNKAIMNYYEEISDKLERYNIELKIDDKGKDTKKYSLMRSYSAYSEPRKKRDHKLVGRDMRALLKVIYIMPEPVEFLKDIANNIEALVVLPSGELENYYNSKNKTYNLTRTIDK